MATRIYLFPCAPSVCSQHLLSTVKYCTHHTAWICTSCYASHTLRDEITCNKTHLLLPENKEDCEVCQQEMSLLDDTISITSYGLDSIYNGNEKSKSDDGQAWRNPPYRVCQESRCTTCNPRCAGSTSMGSGNTFIEVLPPIVSYSSWFRFCFSAVARE